MGLESWKTKTEIKCQGDEIVSKILTKSNIEERERRSAALCQYIHDGS